MRSIDRQARAQGYSALSSAYYSIAGTAFSQLKASLRLKWLAPVKVAMWCLTWLPLAAWCYWRMLPLSNRVVALVGYDGMSADECDIRQSVLRRRGKNDEAEKCIRDALAKNPKKAHTRGLLRVGLADIFRRKARFIGVRAIGWATEQIREALVEAVKAETEDPRQAARIYRKCADIIDFLCLTKTKLVGQTGSELRRKAQILAETTGAQDQLLKLR